jgi:hypothetical protein
MSIVFPLEISCDSSFFSGNKCSHVPFSAYHLKKLVEQSEKSVLGLVEKKTYPTVKINNVLSVAVLLQHMAKPWEASSGLAATATAMSMAPQQRQPWHRVAVYC